MKNLRNILVIDCDREFADTCRAVCEADSCRVAVASDEWEARDMISDCPDLIVLGTLSPAGQAFSLHSWIRNHAVYRTIPLMVIDAHYDEMQIRGWRVLEGMSIEADEYLSKPVDLSTLPLIIKNLSAKSRANRKAQKELVHC